MKVEDKDRYQAFLDAAEALHGRDASGDHERACGDPDCPGWAVFMVDREPGAEVEKCDMCARFAYDDEAIEHVLAAIFGVERPSRWRYEQAGMRPPEHVR